MLFDLIIVGLAIAAAVWGYRQGLSSGALALIGFGGGVILGSRVAPLLLDGGLRDPFAPVVALPAALLFGALLAVALERVGLRVRRRVRGIGRLDGIGGAALAACLGLVVVWMAGSLVARIDSLRDDVRGSAIIKRLNAVLPPPGPLLTARENFDPLPVIVGPKTRVGPVNGGIKRDPEVRGAAGSVIKIFSEACGRNGSGSGWVAADGLVVTNAHVVAGSDDVRVQARGVGLTHEAEAVWFDDINDIAILRTAGLDGVRPLPLDPKAKPGTFSAVLGFPGGGGYTVVPARLGPTAEIPGRRVGRDFVARPVTSLRAGVRPGNSGGPAVDDRGRVVTMVFAGSPGGHRAFGVPLPLVAKALRLAQEPDRTADTGDCVDE
ncbi:MAG: CvpA family protein [Thermoleophilaceae bacterium]